jgi:hypothetical protein
MYAMRERGVLEQWQAEELALAERRRAAADSTSRAVGAKSE